MAGDEGKPEYSAFFAREFGRVKRAVYLVVQDHGRAEEISQEAFIQLLRHWKKVSTYDKPEAWVRRVAIRMAGHLSTRERMRALLERKATPAPVLSENEPGLAEALRALTAGQRAAIVLHYYEDQSIDEIARILDCSENTVKSHLHRGRNRLRVLLSEAGGAGDGA
jgi:RNA polymerase sigma-70 factor (ECF subfamily)